ncbi:NUDIX hydrolase [Isoptericola sp. b441]|uniref:NUDIX hydrolase n=1 Tax=Actinotalea lenta TaxID=3064654 RepID=A0ABT9D7T0_9CELL|nr:MULTISPECIES: NUDIX hydrolase [unclassified Isoptericola]MDO8106506.1 NUDIX hydrolase [Isoptericola sp. b441]MDO8121778.1 NUDIX hydrolase [Isoptericola sp. b490]
MGADVLVPNGKPQTVHAAGAVVWRHARNRLEVALVHRPRYQDWSWPKGKLESGEPVAAAAVREVEEETGTTIVLGVPLPLMRYRTPDGAGKVVRYWAAREAGAHHDRPLAARPDVTPASLGEIDDVVWVSAATAREMLTRPSDRRPLDALEDLWKRGRLETHVLAVVRHGQAVPRNRWHEGEASRPLTAVGRRQAETTVPVLAAFGVRSVLTSPWERCRATVQPYQNGTGVRVDTVDALTEAAHAEDPQKVVAVVEDLLATPRDAALATHRPVLPTVLDTLAEATRRWTHGVLPGSDPYLRTGEILVAHVAGSGHKARVVAVEHHRPVRRPAAV